jgi:HAD superfamily hydrolase (TIGR01509 family)
MRFAAVIFDLDGTIIKSEKEWGMAFVNVLRNLGVVVDSKHPQTAGVSANSNWEKLIRKYNIKTDKTLDELSVLTYIEYEKLIPMITLSDGVLEFMDVLNESGVQLALATSTKWETTDMVLKQFGLDDYFDSITTGEEVDNPKPAPDIFLLASEKLGIDPADCLVIEDSVSGVDAATDAGMKVIAVSNEEEKEENLEDADLVVESFSEITSEAIDAIALG